MMALWRRVRGAVGGIGDTEWALLGLELVGVVGGILIAFQLQEWAEDRREDRDRVRLTERLMEESQSNVEWAVRYQLGLLEQAEAAQPFAEKIASRQCPTETEFSDARSVTMYPPVQVQRVVLDELASGVGLSGLKDRKLARLVGAYQAENEQRQLQVEIFRSNAELVDRNAPYVDVTYDQEDDDFVFQTDMAALCADPRVRRNAAVALENKVRFAAFVRHSAGAALAVCEALGEKLGKPCSPKIPDAVEARHWSEIQRRAQFFREGAQ